MTKQEAIEKIINLKIINPKDIEAINIAKLELQKTIATTPIIQSEYSPALCPNCMQELSESLGDGYYKHITNIKICSCGQYIDWENI